MSHLPQRKEKDCLNCSTEVIGLYCHKCGQQNIEPKQSFWDLITHFFNDITHFDGKFFSSIKLLITKPGFLSKEYMLGRRASHLNPVRMYLFTSAFFFLIFFSLYKVDENSVKIGSGNIGKSMEEISKMDSAKLDEFTRNINEGKPLTKEQVKERYSNFNFAIAPGSYKSREEYDSILKLGIKNHNWFERELVYKNLALQKKYNGNGKQILIALINKFMHLLPQILFVLLPLYALILKLVYVRRKEYYYVDHVIFTIYFYILVFLVMLITFGISKLKSVTNLEWLGYITGLFILSIFFYYYKALRNFYKQGRGKTILKYFILLLSFSFVTLMMFIFFFLLSMFGL